MGTESGTDMTMVGYRHAGSVQFTENINFILIIFKRPHNVFLKFYPQVSHVPVKLPPQLLVHELVSVRQAVPLWVTVTVAHGNVWCGGIRK